MFKHVLIPTDGSPISEDAVARGIAFAAALGARATAMVVSAAGAAWPRWCSAARPRRC